jgi:5-methyltetrahydropteroyltriglutamate--homocysteine methyltransferase
VQFDEPVLTEVVHGRPAGNRVFMCGALGAKRDAAEELAFAEDLLTSVLSSLPLECVALHICRGNWSTDERVALAGDYGPLLDLLRRLPAGAYLLEMCTPRAGDIELLQALPAAAKIGVGVVNQKSPDIETETDVRRHVERAIDLFGIDRVWLHPDCGFATFADSPVTASAIAEQKLAVMQRVAKSLRPSP